MIKLIRDFKIVSQGQDYAIVGEGEPILTGLTKEEANDRARRLRTGEIVSHVVYKQSINSVNLEYWKSLGNYPVLRDHTPVPEKYVTDMTEVKKTILSDDNDWAFISVKKTLISVMKLGKTRVINIPLNEFKAIIDKYGIALACKLY